MNCAFIVAQFRIKPKHGACVKLTHSCCYRGVLDRVGAACIKAFVHFNLIEGQVYVALTVRHTLLTIQCDALDCATTAKVIPAGFAFPVLDIGTDKLLGDILALRSLECYTASFCTLLLFNCFDGTRKGIVTTFKGIFLCHIDCVASTGTTRFNKTVLFITPGIECASHQIQLIFLDGRTSFIKVHVSTWPVVAVRSSAFTDKDLFLYDIEDTCDISKAHHCNTCIFQNAVKACCSTFLSGKGNAFMLSDYNQGFSCCSFRFFFGRKRFLGSIVCYSSFCQGFTCSICSGLGCIFCTLLCSKSL